MRGWRIKPAKGKTERKSQITSVRCFLVTSVSRRRVLHLDWPESASGFQVVVASKEIEDFDKLEDVKILLSGSPFRIFALAKALSWRRL